MSATAADALADRAPPPHARWRPQSAPPPNAAAITFDPVPDGGALRVLAPWEDPGGESMAEPKIAVPRGAPRARAPARQPAAAARAARPQPAAALPAADAARPAVAQRAPVGRAPNAPTQRSLAGIDTRSFWETLPEALVVPFSGPGLYWIAAISAWSVAVGFLGLLANFMFLLGMFVMFFANTSLLAFTCDYYRVCLWAPASGEKAPERSPDFDPVRILNSYIKSGIHLTLFMMASQVPLIWWVVDHLHEHGLGGMFELATHPITWLLFLLPYYYWPMGVGMTALANNFAAIWNVPAGFRAIARAPLEYTAIVAIGMLALFMCWIGLWMFGSMLGITGAVLSGTIGFPLAISHGLQGALMGHLVRARGEIFEE
jgi:hypothetical protein